MIAKFTRKDFLEALFAEYYREHRGFILVKSVKRGDPKMSTRYFPNIDILAKEHYGEERDVYFGICPRERMKAEKEHVHYLVALWADLDIGSEGHEDKKIYFPGPQEAARAIRSFPRAPSIIVESGRGAHLYWLLRDVVEIEDQEQVEAVIEKISEHLQCDTTSSLDGVLRLPETVNTKIAGKPVNCDVKFINTNFRYSLEDFENLGERVVAPPPPSPVPTPQPEDVEAEIPSFTDDQQEIPAEGAVVSQSMNDSLIVDETIIDELIDDISMTASVVADPYPPPEAPAYVPEPEIEPDLPPVTVEDSETPPAEPSRIIPSSAVSSSMLERLSSTRTEVEISLIGSNTVLNGVLLWNENGLIGVESGADMYTIPLTSVSFIKSRVP